MPNAAITPFRLSTNSFCSSTKRSPFCLADGTPIAHTLLMHAFWYGSCEYQKELAILAIRGGKRQACYRRQIAGNTLHCPLIARGSVGLFGSNSCTRKRMHLFRQPNGEAAIILACSSKPCCAVRSDEAAARHSWTCCGQTSTANRRPPI